MFFFFFLKHPNFDPLECILVNPIFSTDDYLVVSVPLTVHFFLTSLRGYFFFEKCSYNAASSELVCLQASPASASQATGTTHMCYHAWLRVYVCHISSPICTFSSTWVLSVSLIGV